MATELMSIYAKLSLDDKNYNQGITNATKSGENFADKIGSVTAKGISGLAKLTAGAVTAVGGAVIALGKIGLDYNTQMETYTTNFAVMLGSQENAISKVNELKEVAAKTPFGMADLADATQTLLAFQVPAEETADTLQMLGDIALGDKNKMKGLALVFGQVSSAGKLQGQDLMQMINQGFNPLNYISQRTGESMEELRDRMSKGAISAEEVTQAFKDATSEGGQFYKGMEQASKTTAGLISTLKDNAKALVGEVFEPISQSLLSNILPSAISAIDELSTAFKERGIDGMIETAGEILGQVVSTIIEKAPLLINSAYSLVNALIGGIRSNLPKLLSSSGEMITTLVSGFISLMNNIAQTGFEIVMALAQGIAKSLPDLIPMAIQTILDFVDYLLDNIDLVIDTGIDLILGLVEGLMKALPLLIAKMPEIIVKLVEAIIKAVPKIWEAGKQLALGLWDGFKNSITACFDGIKTVGGEVIDKVKGFFGIHSPSKVMQDQIGKYLGEGVNVGFEKSLDLNGAVGDIAIAPTGTATNTNIESMIYNAVSRVLKNTKFDLVTKGSSTDVARILEPFITQIQVNKGV